MHYSITSSPGKFNAQSALRQVRLQILAQAFRPVLSWKLPTERRKIAIHKNRKIAVLFSLLHLLPLTGAMTLLALYWTRYWIGPIFEASVILQFLAKLLELLMQASLMEMNLYIIRTLAVNHYIPLGALSGATQTTQLSYLWSVDFWSIFRVPGFNGYSKMLFAACIPLSLIMTALVGPSAAVLMIPRPNASFVKADMVFYGLNSSDSMFPLSVTENMEGPDPNNTPENNQEILYFDLNNTGYQDWNPFDILRWDAKGYILDPDQYVYDNVTYMDRLGPRRLSFGMKTDSMHGITSYVATLPTQFSALSLYEFSLNTNKPPKDETSAPTKGNPVLSVEMPQPYVEADCMSMKYDSDSDSPVSYIRDNGLRGTLCTLAELHQHIEAVGGLIVSTDAINRDRFLNPLIWIEAPEAASTSLVGIFVDTFLGTSAAPANTFLMNATSNGTKIDYVYENLAIKTCAFRSYWKSTVITLESNLLAIQSDLSQHVNYSIQREHQPLALHLAPDSRLRTRNFSSTLDYYNAPLLISGIISIGLADMPPWFVSVKRDENFQTPFMFTQTVTGYGYGHTSTWDILSVIILTSYCIATMTYVVYTIFTGTVSTAWNSPIELIILALQSKSFDHLGHTSVGIDSMNTFRQLVGIRATNQDALQLVFANNKVTEPDELRKIQPNQEY